MAEALSQALIAVALFSGLATLVAVCSAGFVALVGGWLVWQFGVKLKEYKPRAYAVPDLAEGGMYKLVQLPNGEFELVERETASDDDALVDDEEDFLNWAHS